MLPALGGLASVNRQPNANCIAKWLVASIILPFPAPSGCRAGAVEAKNGARSEARLVEIPIIERPAPDGPYGAKGLGEMCANVPIPAIANAVFDAVGVRIDSLPLTPEKILRALQARRGATSRGIADE